MHVHTRASGECKTPFVRRFCRESYTGPRELYEVLRKRGMDLVTLTDHDSIDGAEALRGHPDFFLSEELTVTMPSGAEAHIGVYDITERQHLQLQQRRNGLPALLAYLKQEQIIFSINHVFSCLTGGAPCGRFPVVSKLFPGVGSAQRGDARPAK